MEVGVMWCKIGSEFIPREHAREKCPMEAETSGESDGRRRDRPTAIAAPELNTRFIFSISVATEQQAALKRSKSESNERFSAVVQRPFATSKALACFTSNMTFVSIYR